MTLNLQIRDFNEFLIPAATHILGVNCAEMAGFRLGLPAYDILAYNVHF